MNIETNNSSHQSIKYRVVAGESQWALIWKRFKKHRLAQISGIVLIFLYTIAAFAEFLSPRSPTYFKASYTYAPPQEIFFFQQKKDGSYEWKPHVLGYKTKVDPKAMKRTFEPNPKKIIEIVLFPKVKEYHLIGVFPLETRLFGTKRERDPFYLLGSDRIGRDLLSRLIQGTRISLSIGLIGVIISLVLGVLIGGISGLVGGTTDSIIQKVIVFLRSLPAIPLWLTLAASLPREWSSIAVYFSITIILSLIGWTELARVVRGRFLAMKTEDFITAAKLDGCSDIRIILRHMVPSFTSHIIASTTLSIPGMILAETALSFLGLGLQPPVVSWGTLMQDAQNIRALSTAPWLLIPGVLAIITILSMNFLGDGLRDAADPYDQFIKR